MSTQGLFEARKHEDCETHLLTTIRAEVQKLWDRTVVHVQQAMEARRYQDQRDQDPDYGRRLRELEGQIDQIDREQQGFRMTGNYNEGGKESSWKDWVLGLVGLAIVAWLGRLSMQMDDLLSMRGEQKMMEKHLESTDSRIDRVETRVYRGSP